MKKPADLARSFCNLAKKDLIALEVLAKSEAVDDSVIGFHSQQVVEKALKAILALHSAEFPRTHDIGELLELIKKNNIELPPAAQELDELNPYAVLLRYEFIDFESQMDRKNLSKIARTVLEWAEAKINFTDGIR